MKNVDGFENTIWPLRFSHIFNTITTLSWTIWKTNILSLMNFGNRLKSLKSMNRRYTRNVTSYKIAIKENKKESHRSCGVATTLGIEAIFSLLVEEKGTQMAIYGWWQPLGEILAIKPSTAWVKFAGRSQCCTRVKGLHKMEGEV